MRIILDDSEKEYLEYVAKERRIQMQALKECYETVKGVDFEQDIEDMLTDYEDELRKDYPYGA